VRRRVLLDYSADYPHRKRPPGKNYSFLLLQPKKYRAPFLKEAETGIKKNKANAITTTTTQQTTPTSKLCVITNRLHLQKASMRESMSKPIRYRASNEVTKSQKKKKRNKQMINTLQTGIERLPPQGLRTDLKTPSKPAQTTKRYRKSFEKISKNNRDNTKRLPIS
jgi:hypothetical protein